MFQIAVKPLRVDILTDISAVDFADAWARRDESAYGDVPVRASGRPGDLRDVEALLEDLGEA